MAEFGCDVDVSWTGSDVVLYHFFQCFEGDWRDGSVGVGQGGGGS